jgi:iron complex outermembrane receptor protein
MKSIVLFTAMLLFKSVAFAQPAGTISGHIVKTDTSIAATISLLRARDSATVKLAVSSRDGRYDFEKITLGKYLIVVNAVGYRKVFSQVIDITAQQPSVQLPGIALMPLDKELAAVTVTAKRPLLEQRIDRTIVNVDASITNAGTSALEVLEKSPGITVDSDGNISLKGKQGVMIMVDGRPTQLNGADLANLLRNMSSTQLDQIEIMTNPPSRYDASGTSGVINIKTKKNITAGSNGSVSLAYSQGRYPKTNEGFNYNYREGKINLFTNLSHNYQKRFQTLTIDRNIFNGNTGSVEKIFSQEANRVIKGNTYNAKLGADFFASKKTTVGAVVNIGYRNALADNPNTTHIANASKVLESTTRALVNTDAQWNSFSANLNFRKVLGNKNKEITADIDFLKYGTDNTLFMENAYADAAGNPLLKADTILGLLPQDIHVYSARIDYLHPLKNNARFEAGIKSSLVRTDNNANYDSIQFGKLVHDFNRSNHFIYEENINAAYVNLNASLSKKITAQFGLRMENTNAKGIQRTTGETFDRHYTQLFPTAYFQYKAGDNNNIGLNFGRRVLRPGYQGLNPFIRFIDRYTYGQGNPNLKPALSSNIELTHTWKNRVTTTLNFTNVKDIIQEVVYQKGQEAYDMPANVASLNQIGIAVNAANTITPWWKSNININLSHVRYQGILTDTEIDQSATNFVLNGTQQFKLGKSLNAELNGAYRSGWLEGVRRIQPVGMVGAGISLLVLKGQGTLRLTARDIFFTQRLHGKAQYGNVDFAIGQVSDTRIVTVGFTYSFSKGKKIGPVKRTAGSANEEQGRIGQ